MSFSSSWTLNLRLLNGSEDQSLQRQAEGEQNSLTDMKELFLQARETKKLKISLQDEDDASYTGLLPIYQGKQFEMLPFSL